MTRPTLATLLASLTFAACATSYQHGRHVEQSECRAALHDAGEAWHGEREALYWALVDAAPAVALEFCATDQECETAERRAAHVWPD